MKKILQEQEKDILEGLKTIESVKKQAEKKELAYLKALREVREELNKLEGNQSE